MRALLSSLARRYRVPLAVTYGLTVAENACEVLYPFAIGYAIDGLLSGRPGRLTPLVGLWLGHAGVGLFRHVYDSRVFNRIYADLAGDTVARQREAGVAAERVAARVSLSREVVGFLEAQVPAAITSVLRFGGAVLMLFLYDAVLGTMAVAALVPVVLVNRWFARRARRLNGRLNNRLEREVAVVAGRSSRTVRRHFEAVRGWRVRISDAEARAWGMLEFVMIALTFGALLRLSALDGATAGTVYAVLAYVFALYDATSDLPAIVQNVSRARDIGERVAAEPGIVPDR